MAHRGQLNPPIEHRVADISGYGQLTGDDFLNCDFGFGSGCATGPLESTGGYAAHSGRPTADGASRDQAAGLADASRP